eukprot:6185821-Pleurochrysis_carterae.AAC.2
MNGIEGYYIPRQPPAVASAIVRLISVSMCPQRRSCVVAREVVLIVKAEQVVSDQYDARCAHNRRQMNGGSNGRRCGHQPWDMRRVWQRWQLMEHPIPVHRTAYGVLVDDDVGRLAVVRQHILTVVIVYEAAGASGDKVPS